MLSRLGSDTEKDALAESPPPPLPPAVGPSSPPPAPQLRPTVPGYGRRVQPPASMLNPTPVAFSAAPLPTVRVERNLALTFAQLLAIVQGVLGIIGGANLMGFDFQTAARFALPAQEGLSSALIADAAVVIIISVVVILAAIRVSHPSGASRVFLALWEAVAILFTAGILFGLGSPLNFIHITVVMVAGTGLFYIHPWIALAMEVFIVYGLVFHPASHDFFSQAR